MVPNISPNGTSFFGAGAYHLHDRSAPTAHRLLFAATRNLANDDASLALEEMHRTASHAALAKQLSGSSPTPEGGDSTTPRGPTPPTAAVRLTDSGSDAWSVGVRTLQ
jgi:hypothetical protein